jgi:hypothetical protein
MWFSVPVERIKEADDQDQERQHQSLQDMLGAGSAAT